MSPPRLIHVADYAPPAGRLLRADGARHARAGEVARLAGRRRPPRSRRGEAPWVEDFAAIGVDAPLRGRRGAPGAGQWLERELGGEPGPTILHTHFTALGRPGGARGPAPRPRRGRSGTCTRPSARRRPRVLRNMAKFASLGRGVSAILCPAPNIADDVRRRLAPRGRVHFLPSVVDVEEFPLLDAEERLRAVAEALGIAPEATVLLHFGWHWHLKGGDIFMATVKELVEGGTEGSDRDRAGLGRGRRARDRRARAGRGGAGAADDRGHHDAVRRRRRAGLLEPRRGDGLHACWRPSAAAPRWSRPTCPGTSTSASTSPPAGSASGTRPRWRGRSRGARARSRPWPGGGARGARVDRRPISAMPPTPSAWWTIYEEALRPLTAAAP